MNVRLVTKVQMKKLLENGKKQQEAQNREDSIDFEPVVKLFTPDAQCTWLLTEVYPADPDVAFGLCDLGMGFPELGDVRLSEIAGLRGQLGLLIERDRGFVASKTLSEYTEDARGARRIVA